VETFDYDFSEMLTEEELDRAFKKVQRQKDIAEIKRLCSANGLTLKSNELDMAAARYRELLDANPPVNWTYVFLVCEHVLNERNKTNESNT